MNELAKLAFPLLNYPFMAETHPLESQVERAMIGWMTEHGLLKDPDLVCIAGLGHFSRFASLQYPKATDEGLRLLTHIFGWLFALDDAIGDTGLFGHSPANLSRMSLWLRAIMDCPHNCDQRLGAAIVEGLTAEQQQLCQAFGSATANIWQRIEAMSSPPQYIRCVEAMTHYFVGILWEAGWHARGCVPHTSEYLVGRSSTSAMFFGLTLYDVTGGYEIPARDYQRQDIRELSAVVSRILALCNDVFSYPKERDETRVMALNYPAVLIRHEGLDEQQALEQTAGLHNQLIDQYLELETVARQCASPQLLRFLAGMRSAMRGHYDWARHSPRYRLDHYFTGLDQT